MTKGRLAPLVAVLLALGVGGAAQTARADIIQFNPSGTGAVGALPIGAFDETVGNAVAVGAAPQVVGAPFQVYYQATIDKFIDNNGNTVSPPAGTQFTIVAGYTETITSITPTPGGPVFTFGFVPGGTNYLEIYANTNPATFANNSAGTGFNTGTLILSGNIFASTPTIGTFTVIQPGTVPFDQFDAVVPAKFVGTQTTVGLGQTFLNSTVNSFDPNYFVTPPTIFSLNFRTSTADPFVNQSPSQLFVSGPGGPGPMYNPNLGAVNGLTGPDVQFEADASNGFTVLPEPTGMTLLSLGLVTGAIGIRIRRKRSA